MIEKIPGDQNEKISSHDWPLIAENMLRALEENNIEEMIRILINYYKKILAYALDDEPSEKLKEAIVNNYGYLNSDAVEAARSQKGSARNPERQVALELSMILHDIFAKLGNAPQTEFFANYITTLQAKLAHLTEKDLKYIWTNPYQSSIQTVGRELVTLVTKNPESISKNLE